MSHDELNNPCFFDHICADEKPCLNVRPLPGQPPVLSTAERKLKEIENALNEDDDYFPESAQEAAEIAEGKLSKISKILKR